MSSPVYPAHHSASAGSTSSRTNYYRPATIAELAAQAQENLWDPSKGLKHWLRSAEKARRNAEALVQDGNYEGAFVEYAKAATIVLEKLPTHREYQTLLNADQRHNLGMNGQDILDSLSQLKPILVDRYEHWQSSQRPSPGSSRPASADPHLTREEERAREARLAASREEAWKQEDYVNRQAQERQAQIMRGREDPDRVLADWPRRDEYSRRYMMDEAKREEERARRVVADERRRQEQDGIAQRQQETEAAAVAARRDVLRLTPSPVPPSISGSSMRMPEPDPGLRHSGRPVYAPQPSRSADHYAGTSNLMPLESPNKYEDDSSTDVEGSKMSLRAQRSVDQTPKGKKSTGVPSSVPMTTTSPAPPELGANKLPSLMSQHQLKQGYVPSLQSMFASTSFSQTPDSSLLFDSNPQTSKLYNNILPSQSTPVAPVIPPYPTHMPVPESHRSPATYGHSQPHPSHRGPSLNGARPSQPAQSQPSASSSSARIVPGSSKDAHIRELRTIKLPRECLAKFLSIARVNTLQNRETCGLLLGKDKGNKYVVTTLLIPKQHSTSDTCMMDEEELVLQFTEDRQLITLGWIHTHPTQSCFMSSVDLHTHSGFQRMLPESFAVVCAPSSTPQFGIFRLTDPEGLQTILECNAKDAFHPHPDVPIYTDCDNSHVQLKELPLEIVDLRF